MRFIKNTFWKHFYKSRFYGFSLRAKPFPILTHPLKDSWKGNNELGEGLALGDVLFLSDRFVSQDILNILQSPKSSFLSFSTYMHSFSFLYDLRETSSGVGRKIARKLIEHWILFNHSWAYKSWTQFSWDTGLIGLRLYHLISLYDFYAGSADDNFKDLLLKSLARQFRHVKRWVFLEKDILKQFWGLKGIFACELVEPLSSFQDYVNLLEENLKHQILPDGGHVTRSPQMQWRILKDLIDIRLIFRTLKREEPKILLDAIHKMATVLRFFRHGDGKLVTFDAVLSPYALGLCSSISSDAVDGVLSQSDVPSSKIIQRLPEMGYERCSNRHAILTVNTSPVSSTKPFFKRSDQACEPALPLFQFEWSQGKNRFIPYSDIVVQQKDQSYLDHINLSETQCIIKRYNKEGHNYLSCETLISNLKTSLHWQRHLYMTQKGESLKGNDYFHFHHDGIVALRFFLNEGFSYHQEKDRFLLFLENSTSSKLKKRHDKWVFHWSGVDEVIHVRDEEHPFILLLRQFEAHTPFTMKWSLFCRSDEIEG